MDRKSAPFLILWKVHTVFSGKQFFPHGYFDFFSVSDGCKRENNGKNDPCIFWLHFLNSNEFYNWVYWIMWGLLICWLMDSGLVQKGIKINCVCVFQGVMWLPRHSQAPERRLLSLWPFWRRSTCVSPSVRPLFWPPPVSWLSRSDRYLV